MDDAVASRIRVQTGVVPIIVERRPGLGRRVLEPGVRVRAYGWRGNRPWQAKGTIIGTYISGIGEDVFIVLGDVPEPDGSCMFDLGASDLVRLPATQQKGERQSRRQG